MSPASELTMLVPAEVCVRCGSQHLRVIGIALHCGGCLRRVVRVSDRTIKQRARLRVAAVAALREVTQCDVR